MASSPAVISETAARLDDVIKRLHRRLTWARTTRSELHKKKDTGLIEREEEQLLLRCDGITLGPAEVAYPNLTTNMSIYDAMPITLTER